ncbi:hypothetical protein D3C71_1055430 [compost metagenome]
MLDDAAIFLRRSRQETRHIHQRQQRNVEGIAEAHETGGLARGVDIEAAGQHHRLVGDNPHRLAFKADEAGDNIAGKGFLQFEEVSLIGQRVDQFLHVVGFVGAVGDQRIETCFQPRRIVMKRPDRRFFAIVERQEIEQQPHMFQRLDVVFISAVSDGGFSRMGGGTAKLFRCDDLVRHGLHHIRPGHEHVGGIAHHEDEIGHGRRIDSTTRTRPHDN